MAIKKELLRRAPEGVRQPEDLFGQDGLLKELTGRLVEPPHVVDYRATRDELLGHALWGRTALANDGAFLQANLLLSGARWW